MTVNIKHGHAMYRKPSKTYMAWSSMKYRCSNKNCKLYFRYGGRGIKVCERWMKFENFLEDMGEAPKGLTLDRINNDGNYEPSNCRWATMKEQTHNYSRNKFVEYKGQRKILADWEKEFGMCGGLLGNRLKKGWPLHLAMTPPLPPGKTNFCTWERLIEFNGEKLSLRGWERKLGLGKNVLAGRLKRGCSLERALMPKDLRQLKISKRAANIR